MSSTRKFKRMNIALHAFIYNGFKRIVTAKTVFFVRPENFSTGGGHRKKVTLVTGSKIRR